ncbi:UDP-phosphate galactose phosphotransferase [Aureimonas sp. SA4125]|uniref:sugar transferase n=1 Tax=Aureimonas sp. SA4125 TaxID=2826993 RepID=UPI001CC42A26|nr:sugar transferase [Aureimonas sp. SA4125]BDA82968.1 UDP-phosphate galactose phosphotransferase [Aureimonas sp. SA4125]
MKQAADAGNTSALDGRARASALVRFAGSVALLATLPIWPLVAAMVWASVGRPLLFRQTRSGRGMRPFTICKFRTMHDARDAAGALLPDALRETPAMRLLRRWRLDELPQLLAIARGEMSFVGPRPLLPDTIQGFGEFGRLRCAVSPGLTGWAQVNGNTRLTDRQKLALDLWYIHHRSLYLDLKILAMTAITIVRGERLGEANVGRATADMEAPYPRSVQGAGR